MRAGHYENDAATVDLMIRSSNSIIRDLVRRGVRFARDENGALRFTREGAHSRARILFHEDITGREITQTLLAEVLRCENIELRENTVMLDFFADAAACGGVVAMGPDGAVRAIGAGAVVLACGGIGGLYKTRPTTPTSPAMPLPWRCATVWPAAILTISRSTPQRCSAAKGPPVPHLGVGARRGRAAAGQKRKPLYE